MQAGQAGGAPQQPRWGHAAGGPPRHAGLEGAGASLGSSGSSISLQHSRQPGSRYWSIMGNRPSDSGVQAEQSGRLPQQQQQQQQQQGAPQQQQQQPGGPQPAGSIASPPQNAHRHSPRPALDSTPPASPLLPQQPQPLSPQPYSAPSWPSPTQQAQAWQPAPGPYAAPHQHQHQLQPPQGAAADPLPVSRRSFSGLSQRLQQLEAAVGQAHSALETRVDHSSLLAFKAGMEGELQRALGELREVAAGLAEVTAGQTGQTERLAGLERMQGELSALHGKVAAVAEGTGSREELQRCLACMQVGPRACPCMAPCPARRALRLFARPPAPAPARRALPAARLPWPGADTRRAPPRRLWAICRARCSGRSRRWRGRRSSRARGIWQRPAAQRRPPAPP
jgi:hypothetical protein